MEESRNIRGLNRLENNEEIEGLEGSDMLSGTDKAFRASADISGTNVLDAKEVDIDELLSVNPVEKTTKSKISIESMVLNSYIYIHSDNRRLMSAKRSLKGFNIYDLRTNALLCQLQANLFGTRYSMNKQEGKTENQIRQESYIESMMGPIEQIEKKSSPVTSNSVKKLLPSLEVVYDVRFLKRDKPRSFNVKLGELQLQNKQPIYNPETNSYSLNFSGRVTVASVKNFQIVHPLDPTFITLTFGKEANDSFILDYTHPWNPLQAFCVGLTALDHKLGFE